MSASSQNAWTPPMLRVRIGTSPSNVKTFRFNTAFRIGRGEGCEVRAAEDCVSRNHASVTFENGQWWIRDLDSANGLIVNGQKVPSAAVGQKLLVRIGPEGPFVSLELDTSSASQSAPTPVQQANPAPPAARPQMPMPGVTTPHTQAQAQQQPPPSALPTGSRPVPTMSTKASVPAAPGSVPLPQQPPQSSAEAFASADVADKYFGKLKEGEVVGERTMMIRQAFQEVQKKQRFRWGSLVAVLLVAVAGIGAFAYYQRQESEKQKTLAQDIFYTMKGLDVDIANVQKMVMESNNERGAEQVNRYRARRLEMQKNYDRYLNSLHVYNKKMSEQERLVLRVARIYGECELTIPEGFNEEVQNYIKKWQSSPRYAAGIRRAQENGYTKRIADEMIAQGLPPQFFYLALQESNFDALISGPETYMGYAKGMWQFIPQTGLKYGLTIGPLADLPRPDPADGRHQWEKATNAAARYLSDLYTKEAMGSGLLVMASYNWGEHKVKKLINSLPANNRERNFWVLLEKYKDDIPKETYDYVYYIFSASVIGENPRLFGFDFDNPLSYLDQQRTN